ncbi:37106_t:CDS:2, partial [Gigaspora margarita]
KYENAEAIIYSGLIFIRIHSGKHDTSTAYTHSKDFDDLISDERLYNFTTTEDSQSKPVVLMLTDSSPDENPCYKKTMIIEHFIKYDLDTIIAVCFTSHQSASNPVERQMMPLSHDLARIILPYDTFGLYLDEQLKIANDELEKFLVEYVDPEEHYQSRLDEKSVVKYNDTSCCRPFCSGILQLFPTQFFSPPILVQQKSYGICAASINASDDTTHFSNFLLSTLMAGKLIPLEMNLQCFSFDWYSPTINKSINEYLCSFYNQSFQDMDHLVHPIVVVHNYQYSEFLVSNNKGEAM